MQRFACKSVEMAIYETELMHAMCCFEPIRIVPRYDGNEHAERGITEETR